MLWILLFICMIGPETGQGETGQEKKCGPETGQGETGQEKKCGLKIGEENQCKNTLNLTNATTSQSSNHYFNPVNYTSDRAIDGNISTCSNTKGIHKSWWRLDLHGVYNISCISIYNIAKDHTDMKNSKIYIGNSLKDNGTSNKEVCTICEITKTDYNTFKPDVPAVGRYIIVTIPDNKPVILCEVNITATVKESPFVLIKKKMMWEDALYYCRDNYEDLASILDEEAQTLAELEAEKADTGFVWLGLHFTCTLQFWFWVDDHSVQFKHWLNDNENKTADCAMSGAMEKSKGHWVVKSDFDKYNFICAK
ncbi:uncharacterized protein PAE49_005880 isoform 2-T2 [Odontesthes bonariensis]|uniref:uncharacterized protein LOC142379753 n=1 Tax=Odontesthes bonariensis TaxID=219752 RepID=UPI003F58D261